MGGGVPRVVWEVAGGTVGSECSHGGLGVLWDVVEHYGSWGGIVGG